MDEGEESCAELVIAGGDAAEILKLVEETLDVVALAVERLGPAEALFAPDHVGNVGNGAAGLDVGSQSIGIIGLVGDNDGAAGEIGQKRFGARQIMGLSGRNQELKRPALAIDAGVDFRREPAPAAPHTTIATLFLTPEACW